MMLTSLRLWAPLWLISLGVQQSFGNKQQAHESYVYQDVTVVDTKTVISPITVPVTRYATVDVTKPHYVDVTYYVTTYVDVTATKTQTSTICVTELTTTTLHYTVSTTEVDSTTITNTGYTTITNTKTTETTITNTETSTTTVLSTEVDPCPKSCSISAATVNFYFWPTNRPATYPTTYVHPTLSYTFTSPSVYMFVPTAAGTKPGGERAGPATSSWMIPLHLDEVSTIAADGATGQLTLADLRTDCPQSAEPSDIATMVNSACDPILAAPRTVSKWAYPCNACGRFGLFDPPYAVPTLPGGLVPTTAPPPPVTVTAQPVPTTTAPPPPPVSSEAPVTVVTPTTTPTTSPTTVATASAAKVASRFAWIILSLVGVIFLVL